MALSEGDHCTQINSQISFHLSDFYYPVPSEIKTGISPSQIKMLPNNDVNPLVHQRAFVNYDVVQLFMIFLDIQKARVLIVILHLFASHIKINK